MRRIVGIITCLLAQAGTGLPENPVVEPSQEPKGLRERSRGPALGSAMEFDRIRTEGIRAYVEKDYKEAIHYFQAALAMRPGDEVTQAWLRAAKYKLAVPNVRPSAAASPGMKPGSIPEPPRPSTAPETAGGTGPVRPQPVPTPPAMPTPPTPPQQTPPQTPPGFLLF